jgi:L-alanine-DL-glutamate epimerase-like enolase superfamily enzyme
LRDEKGFTAFKWRVGAEAGRDRDEWPGRTKDVVPTVSRALGDGVDKLVDGNSCYSPARAIEVGRMLEQNGIGHFEEPCPYWEYDQTAEVRAALELDVAGGEQDCEFSSWQLMLEHRSVDIVQPDVMYMGGMHRTIQVCRMAASHGLPVTPHAANLGLVTMCTMHLLRAIPNPGKYLEFSIGLLSLAGRVVPRQSLPDRGWPCCRHRRARLGGRDQSRLAGCRRVEIIGPERLRSRPSTVGIRARRDPVPGRRPNLM